MIYYSLDIAKALAMSNSSEQQRNLEMRIQEKTRETSIQLEFLVARPETSQLLVTIDRGTQSVVERFDTFVNNPDFFNEYSCIYLAESITQLYAGELMIDHQVNKHLKHVQQSIEVLEGTSYPFIVSLSHRSHFSTIVCLDLNTHIYLDYFQETDRKQYPDIFPRQNFQFFNMDREQFLDFMQNIYAKPDLNFYQSFLGPLQVRTVGEYLDQAIVERVQVYGLLYLSNAKFMQAIKHAYLYIVHVLDTHFDKLDRAERIVHNKEKDIAKLNSIYNRILDTALEFFQA